MQSAALLGLYLATWSYVLAVVGTTLLAEWSLWKWLHMRSSHVENLPGEGGTKGGGRLYGFLVRLYDGSGLI